MQNGRIIDPPKDDARHRLNQLADSKLDEEESSMGPICFGPCIRNEPFPPKFTRPRDMPKYTGAVKPEPSATSPTELCNSCEGVGEEQAIGYFTDGSREGSLMKHKLHRAKPKTMAEFMAIADKYASADSAARVQYAESVPTAGQAQPASGQGVHHNRDRHGKRKDEHHDNKYGSKKVAGVQGSPGATGGSQNRKGDKFNKDKYTIEVMLDQPCKFHSVSGKLAGHTTCQCSFTRDLE
jgi:hypothetical protein